MILTISENKINFAITHLTDVKVEWIQVGREFGLHESFTSLGEEKSFVSGRIFVLFDDKEVISLHFKLSSSRVND